MRDYITMMAQSRQHTTGFAGIYRILANWQARRAFYYLLSLEDCHLSDVGLSRQDLAELCRLPLTCDLAWEAERLRLLAARHPKVAGNAG